MNEPFNADWLIDTVSHLLKDTSEVRWTRTVKQALAFAAFENVHDHQPAKLLNEMLRLCHDWEADQFEKSPYLEHP